MALSVKNIYSTYKNKFKLNLIAGQEGLNRTISWIYYTEDSSTIEFIRGGELAITLGVNFERQKDNKGDDSESLTEFLKVFIENFSKHNASGLIINTGKFILEVPEEIKALCNELNLPLFTMPWEVHTIDVMQEVGNLIATEQQNALTVENLFYTSIFAPENLDSNQILNTPFHDAKEYAVSLLDIDMERFNNDIEAIKRYLTFSFIPKLSVISGSIASFIHNQKVIFILKDNFLKTSKEIARIAANDKFFYGMKVSLSDSTDDIKEMPFIYEHALATMALSDSVASVTTYDSLGIYKLLVEIKNRKVLEQLYTETLGKLNIFTEDKLTDYMKTLELFLKYGGNIQRISEENSNHRNTIIYRIKKIEDTMGINLSDGDTRCMVQMAIYIKRLLSKSDEYLN